MNSLQRGVTAIIYSALTGQKISLPEDLNFSECVKIAKRHRIEVMFYHGALNCGFEQNEPLMKELFMSACKSIVLSEQQSYAFAELLRAFDIHKIDFMPIKGIVLKGLYSNPQMRSMGDLDILIKTEQYDKIKPVMQALGYAEVGESNHELIWHRQNIHIELHKRLIPSYNKDYYAYFGDGWRLAKENYGTRYSMTDEDMLIFLFTHFAKHYRDGGIGLRHMTDLWVYRKSKPDLNEEYINNELKSLQLYEFYVNIINTLGVWFDGRKSDEKTDYITDFIFKSGIYGTGKAHILSEAVKMSKSVKSAKNVKAKKFFRRMFLPYKDMCGKYPFLKRIPVLLPFMWIYRLFNAVLFKGDRIKSDRLSIKLMTEENIKKYQDALNFVGLDFNFKE